VGPVAHTQPTAVTATGPERVVPVESGRADEQARSNRRIVLAAIALAILPTLIAILWAAGTWRHSSGHHAAPPQPGVIDGKTMFGGGPPEAAILPEVNFPIRMQSSTGGETATTRTDQAGRYSFRIAPGSYFISIECATGSWSPTAWPVQVVSGSVETGPTLGCGANVP
jgi:hypothetical protein